MLPGMAFSCRAVILLGPGALCLRDLMTCSTSVLEIGGQLDCVSLSVLAL